MPGADPEARRGDLGHVSLRRRDDDADRAALCGFAGEKDGMRLSMSRGRIDKYVMPGATAMP